MERRIAAIWKETLQLDAVGIKDNFFHLGGDSLLLTRIHQNLLAVCGTEVPVVALFEHLTIEALAKHLTGVLSGATTGDVPSASQIANRRRQSGVRRLADRRQRITHNG
jgi:hypothetical protein